MAVSLMIVDGFIANNLTGSKDITIGLSTGATVGPVLEGRVSDQFTGNVTSIVGNNKGTYNRIWHVSSSGVAKKGTRVSAQISQSRPVLEFYNQSEGVSDIGIIDTLSTLSANPPDNIKSDSDKARIYDELSTVLSNKFEVHTAKTSDSISKTFCVGSARVDISFNTQILEGIVSATVLGLNVGRDSVSPKTPVHLVLDTDLAKLVVDVTIGNRGILLKIEGSTPLEHNITFGSADVIQF